MKLDMFLLLLLLSVLLTGVAAACDNSTCEVCDDSDQCSVCKPKYYSDNNGGCRQCYPNCVNCSSYNACTRCVEGSFLRTHSLGIVDCQRCYGYCSNCTSYEQCGACITGRYGAGCREWCPSQCINCTSSKHCFTCRPGYHGVACETRCPPRCTECLSSTECTACNSGYYGVACAHACPITCANCTSPTQCMACKPGYYGDTCTELCPSTCFSCSNTTHCTACKARYYGETCTVGCPVNCVDCLSPSQCTSCKPKYYGDTCMAECPEHCFNCTSPLQCKSCEAGYYGIKCEHSCQDHCLGGACSKQRCTRGCREGYYPKFIDFGHEYVRLCHTCISSCKTCSSHEKCLSCKAGKYGSTCLSNCTNTCPDGSCDISEGQCTLPCTQLEGYYRDETGECSACSTTCKACITTSTKCTQCHSDGYLHEGSCITCSDGQYVNKTGHCSRCADQCKTCITTSTKCTACHNGYSLSGGTCITCNEGQFLDTSGHCSSCTSSCKACVTTSNKCTKCHSGRYLFGSSCNACPAGCKECSEASTCSSCEDGYYSNGQACVLCMDTCLSCTNNTKCTRCKSGTYGGACQYSCQDQCVNGECTIAGCTKGCKDSYYRANVNICKLCQTPCTTCSNYETCTSCNAGKYGSACGSVCIETCPDGSCEISTGRCNVKCAEGQYLDQTGKCSPCTHPCKECVSTSTKCNHCKPGYRLQSNTCVPDVTCSSKCKDTNCDSDGKCLNGCSSSDRFGPKCEHRCSIARHCTKCTGVTSILCIECTSGYYIQSGMCEQCSGNCKDGSSCQQDDGACAEGCLSGWSGATCLVKCPNNCSSCFQNDSSTCVACKRGYYGTLCDKRCSANCVASTTDSVCNKVSGICTGGCVGGTWGPRCDKTCSDGCLGTLCLQGGGRCHHCIPDKYGVQCDQDCSKACVHPGNGSNVCRKSDGVCLFGCSTGSQGPECISEGPLDNPTPGADTSEGNMAIVIAGAVGGAVIIIVVVSLIVIVCFIRRWLGKHSGASGSHDTPLKAITSPGSHNAPSHTMSSGVLVRGQDYTTRQPGAANGGNQRYENVIPNPGAEISDSPYTDLTNRPNIDEHQYELFR